MFSDRQEPTQLRLGAMNTDYSTAQSWNCSSATRTMTDRIHAEVKSIVSNSRLIRKSEGIALIHRRELQLGELLGRGAFSEVYEVRVINNPGCDREKRYAMKHLKAKLLTQTENFRLAAAELAVEAHMLASFDHPNVMKIRGWAANGVASFTDGRHDSFFLVLDRLDETLDQRISTWQKHSFTQPPQHGLTGSLVSDLLRRFSIGPMTDDTALQHHRQNLQYEQQHAADALLLEKMGISVEIAAGLAYLHYKGVIFRDLKPNNIGFLNGRVQLFDFGLSRELPSLNLEEPFEMSGKVVGIYKLPNSNSRGLRRFLSLPSLFDRELCATWHLKLRRTKCTMCRPTCTRGPWSAMKYLFLKSLSMAGPATCTQI